MICRLIGGSIPACAGEPLTLTGISTSVRSRVYPRVCGGTTRPCVSGKRSDEGSIPACAGEPRRSASSAAPARVYPRVCGGTQLGNVGDNWAQGLSPRVRGNLGGLWTPNSGTGSIPACAGGTSHACPTSRAALGLSPRVRGNLVATRVGPVPPGSIPACAGEPGPTSLTSFKTRVYPRVCGGTFLNIADRRKW